MFGLVRQRDLKRFDCIDSREGKSCTLCLARELRLRQHFGPDEVSNSDV